MKLNKFFILLLTVNFCIAQFKTTGKLNEVLENGFHEIKLSPEIRAASQQNLSDIRIFNSKGNEIPYFIQNSTVSASNNFEAYTIISKKTITGKNTSVLIEIPVNHKTNQLSLFIANSDTTKKYSISGSDDQKDWFGVSDSQLLSDLSSTTETSVVKTISYPLNTYRYLKIDFDDKKTLPINIIKAGNFTSSIQAQTLEEIVPKKFSEREIKDIKETEIHVLFDSPQIINQIVFEISKPTYYSRNVFLFKKVKRQVKRKTQLFEEEMVSFELNSNVKNSFTIPEIFEKDFYIKIQNQDNLPLSISSVRYYQKPISIIAELNAGEEYVLKTGNPNLSAPDYDIADFKNKAAKALPQINIHDIQFKSEIKTKNDQKAFWQQSWFMWACIILGGLTILYFTASLVKDLKKQS